ncbi:MAG: hypothetical protein KF870_05115 [Leadbetterella sp.]|nr:hypothetical protein [Leadbetterella sp.]
MKLEEYIRQNKAAFEEEAPLEAWTKIRQQLPRRKTPWATYIRYAAALLVFLGAGYLIGLKSGNPELAELETYDAALVTYAHKVDQKKARLETLVSNQPELEETFSKDLSDLQKDFEYLKAQLPNNPNREAIINAMISNLEGQIELLNQQTRIAEKRVKNYL